jgi:FkbM family methyltransferase
MAATEKTYEQLIQQGADYLNANLNEEALDLLEKAIAMQPNIPDLHYGKAIALARLGYTGEAIETLHELLISNPQHSTAKQLLNELQMSVQVVTQQPPQMPQTTPSNVLSMVTLRQAESLLNSGKKDVEQTLQQQALSLCEQANPLMANGDFAGALQLFDAALRLYPQIQNLQHARAFCLFQLKRFGEAKIAIEAELMMQPTNQQCIILQHQILSYHPTIPNRRSFSLNQLDVKLEPYLGFDNGFFIEVGANDGVSQSNSLYFEIYKNWRGLLIEAIPELFEKCKNNRPNNIVENYALVPFNYPEKFVDMQYCNLMSFVKGAMPSDVAANHLKVGCKIQNIETYPLKVTAITLTELLDKHHISNIDLFSLDVEGFELSVLKGIDFDKYKPKFMVIEVRNRDRQAIDYFLSPLYDVATELSTNQIGDPNGYCDVLYKLR